MAQISDQASGNMLGRLSWEQVRVVFLSERPWLAVFGRVML